MSQQVKTEFPTEGDGAEKISAFLEILREKQSNPENQDWMAHIVPNLSLHSQFPSGPHPRCHFRFTVKRVHANQMSNLHGGCTATIADVCTSLVLYLVAKPGFWNYLGVSRTLNTTYLKPIPVGSTIDIECTILGIGKKICTTKAEFRAVGEDGTLGALLAVCEHGKVNTDPPAGL